MQTIADFLRAHFGESANAIDGIDNEYIGKRGFKAARFIIGTSGRTFVYCGGECLISFSNAAGMRGTVYLVLDDFDGKRWDGQRGALAVKFANRIWDDKTKCASYPDMTEADWKAWHSPRPTPRLRLVASD